MEFFFGVFDNDEFRKLDFLNEEQTRLTELFERIESNHSERFGYFIQHNLGFDEFKKYLKAKINTMTMFHFSGHHGSDSLQLTDQLINDEELITLLNNSDCLKMVFLNGCATESVITKLTKIPIVIGTKEPVNDYVAMEISVDFYELLIGKEKVDLDTLLDCDKIEKRFNQAKGFENLAKKGRERGEGGWNEQIAQKKTDNYIFQVNKNTLPNFAERMMVGLTPDKYPAKESYKNLIEKWFEETDIEAYELEEFSQLCYRYFPKPFSHFLRKICPIKGEEQVQVLNEERLEIIQNLFFSLLTFLKYCGFAFLWDFLLNDDNPSSKDKLQADGKLKEKIKDELENNWFQITNRAAPEIAEKITFLVQLFKTIGNLYPENEFGQECLDFLNKEESKLKGFCEIFSEKSDLALHARFMGGESFLKFFLKTCSFFRHYKMGSVHKSLFFRYKIEKDKYRYTVHYFSKDNGKKGVAKIETNTRVFDVYSMMLEKKRNPNGQENCAACPPVLNLSPFYVDKNIGESATDQINLECLAYFSPSTKNLLYFSLADENMKHPKPWKRKEKTESLIKIYEKAKIYDHIDKLIEIIQ